MTRRGFVLVELLVATLLSSMAAILIGKLLLSSAARLRDRSERMGLEQSLRVSAGAAQAVLEPLGIDGGSGADLAPGSSSSLVARVVRGFGVLCEAAHDRLVVRAGTLWWRATRAPVFGRDSLIVASIAGADQWMVAPLTNNVSSGSCPDGSIALIFPTALSPPVVAAIGAGSPVQVFEPVELRLYASGGAGWAGLRLVATGEAVQPLAGPFSLAGSGMEYRDSDGNAVLTGPAAAMVVMGLGGITERAGGFGVARLPGAGSDSVRVAIALRGRQ